MKSVIFIIKNHLGEIISPATRCTEEELDKIITLSKSFYANDAGFEMWTDDGFVIVPPEITRQSILTLNIKDDNEELDH